MDDVAQTAIGQKILRWLYEFDKKHRSQLPADPMIAEQLGISRQQTQDYLDLLDKWGYVRVTKTMGPKYIVVLQAEGRMAVREPAVIFAPSAPAAIVNVVNMLGGKIENLIQAGDQAVIHQAVSPSERDAIASIIDHMVALVRQSDVDNVQMRDYELEAQSLNTELQKSKPNLIRVRELLAILGDISGALGLAGALAPYFEQLKPLLEKLLGV